MYPCLKNMKSLNFKDFMKKYNLKNDTIQKIYNYPFYPRDSKIFSDRGFINIGGYFNGGSHWCCFIVIDNKSFYFDSFGGQPDKFLLKQLRKPIIYHNYKIQDINLNYAEAIAYTFSI